MSVKAVREISGMQLLARALNEHLPEDEQLDFRACKVHLKHSNEQNIRTDSKCQLRNLCFEFVLQVTEKMMSHTDPESQFPWDKLKTDHPWLKGTFKFIHNFKTD